MREMAELSIPPDGTLLHEWTLRGPTADVAARLYGTNGTFHFWAGDAAWYHVRPAERVIEVAKTDDDVRREERLWGIPTALCFLERGDIALHAAAVEVAGGAILLAAPGRYGKTTLALAFHRRGHRLLTEDTTCCRLGSPPLLLPGPTSLRLRPDMFDGAAPKGTRIVSVRSDRIHLVLDSDCAGDGLPVPVKALVFLREPAEHILLERVNAAQALPDLWTLNFHLRSQAGHSRSFGQLAQLAGSISLWNLRRPFSLTNLDDVISRIIDRCL